MSSEQIPLKTQLEIEQLKLRLIEAQSITLEYQYKEVTEKILKLQNLLQAEQ